MQGTQVKIEWLTKSPAMKAYFDGDKTMQFTGGTLYEIDAIQALSKTFNISVNLNYIKRENVIKYYLKNHQKTIEANVCVTDPYVLAFGKLDFKKFNIAMIHHIDEGSLKQSVFGRFFLKNLLKNLKKVDLVVVVSKYWKQYLEYKGVQNIEVIYNSYQLKDFEFDVESTELLKQKLDIDPKKPTIYLGKLGTGKGVDKAANHLDESKYNLIATGKQESPSDNYKTVYLSKKEYPILLSVADVVLCMSTMTEGWNRIAHESMLVKTPVIGSGTGGMKELLESAGQTLVTDFKDLEIEVQKVLAKQEELGNLAYEYVKRFDTEYFGSEWTTLMNNISQVVNT